jgi:hypothetical protein
MPAYGEKGITEEQAKALVAHMKSLKKYHEFKFGRVKKKHRRHKQVNFICFVHFVRFCGSVFLWVLDEALRKISCSARCVADFFSWRASAIAFAQPYSRRSRIPKSSMPGLSRSR